MNVIVSNRQKEIIDNANIDAIKDLNGLFSVDDLINKFKNYFFSKMILDATSVVNFASKEVLETLAEEIGAEKLIILLPSSPEPPLEFKKVLIDLKIYNFTTNIEDVIKFIEKPNTYEDAIKQINYSTSDNIYVDNSIKEGEMPIENEDVSDDEEEPDYTDSDTNQSSLGDILSNLNMVDSPNEETETNDTPVNNTELNYQNDSNDFSNIMNNMVDINNYSSSLNEPVISNQDNIPMVNNDASKNVFLISDDYNNTEISDNKPKKMVIGIQNITSHAGSTSLIYMIHKMLKNMKKDVLSVEIGKNDFRLFRDSKMITTDENNVKDVVEKASENVILVDLNNSPSPFCDEVLYLVEPSTIKLNELMATKKDIFKQLVNKKVVLNKSMLSPSDIRLLASEAGIDFFYNIESLNDRIFNDTINKLINLLGIK